MSTEGDGGEKVSGMTTLMVTQGLTPDHLTVAMATEDAAQQATLQAVLQAAGRNGEALRGHKGLCSTSCL